MSNEEIAQPPDEGPEFQRGGWFDLPDDDPVCAYLDAALHPEGPAARDWQAGRLSGAVYLYRENGSGWAAVVKFYAVKTGDHAQHHAQSEFEQTNRARAAGLDRGTRQAIRPLSAWRGALFLEYVDGLTLEDAIAVRRSRPGTLEPALEGCTGLLARLHARSAGSGPAPDFAAAVEHTHKVIDTLSRYGVLQHEPLIRQGLERLLQRWAERPHMRAFVPVTIHGDATSSNFILPWPGGVVAIDWERSYPGDPAADLGRLLAEVAHSLKQHGGSVAEALPLLQHLRQSYVNAWGEALPDPAPAGWDSARLLERTRFYQAGSTLRIARNGWISRLDRTTLVAQAIALLSD